ncbi:MAG: threonylcarbamoyl-AMP synthase [Muribaculaceae bacterium]|nr:threonylcarbamoyl-AMP synthase [Muribaculaceae bacterium]
MKILKMYSSSINERYLDEIVETLRDGGVIIYPTDTIYAIGCDALSNRAIESVCRLKGIDCRKETLSIVASDMSMASQYGRIDNDAFRLMRANLPGPFTFILPAATTLPKVFKGRKTVGIRIPDNAIARAIAERLGNPILSSSITGADDAELSFPPSIAERYERADVALMVDGGDGGVIGSTVVDLTDSRSPEITRQGAGNLI